MADLLTGETFGPPAALLSKARMPVGPQPSFLLGPRVWQHSKTVGPVSA